MSEASAIDLSASRAEQLPLQATNQKQLLREPVFRALFVTQFTGAFNDNFYKSALLMLFTYGGIHHWGIDINIINNLISATLIIPFLLFATLMGQVADKYERSAIIRRIKVAEVLIMCAGGIALWLGSPLALLLVLLCTGVQSACFSPLKYAIVPQLVKPEALVGANALMHSGTSIAIFLGMISGSLAAQVVGGKWIIGLGALSLAMWGWYSSCKIPAVAIADKDLALKWNPWTQTRRTLGYAASEKLVFWLIIGLSWYWFLGSIYLTQIPNLARSVLMADPMLVPILLLLFLLGLSVGSLACERFSKGQVNPRLVPVGALGVTVMGIELVLACKSVMAASAAADVTAIQPLAVLMGRADIWRVVIDVALLGVCGGVYVVPMAALLQSRSDKRVRAQIMGANNVYNALFMVASAIMGAMLLGKLGWTIPDMFIVVVLLHLLICGVIFWRVAEFRQSS